MTKVERRIKELEALELCLKYIDSQTKDITETIKLYQKENEDCEPGTYDYKLNIEKIENLVEERAAFLKIECLLEDLV